MFPLWCLTYLFTILFVDGMAVEPVCVNKGLFKSSSSVLFTSYAIITSIISIYECLSPGNSENKSKGPENKSKGPENKPEGPENKPEEPENKPEGQRNTN